MTDFLYRASDLPDGEKPRSVRDRLVPPMPTDVLLGWIGPLIVTVFGAYLRFVNLGQPNAFSFDETFYAKDAFGLLSYGAERDFVEGADDLLISGNHDVFKACEQVAQCAHFSEQPPFGKWIISIGEMVFGVTPYGWRFMPALIGTLSILVLARVTRRMTRSTLLGCLAGFLLALDGLHFVLSRSALLDIFLMFWVLAAFACLVNDRDWARRRLTEWHESAGGDADPDRPEKSARNSAGNNAADSAADGAGDSTGDGAGETVQRAARETRTRPRLGIRPWRLAAGLCLGLALSVKWSGIYYIIAFTIMSLLWDAGARRALGLSRPYFRTLRRDVPLTAVWTGVVPILIYLASFAGWLATDRGWGRHWDQATSGGPIHFVTESVRSLIDYQQRVLSFHTNLKAPHGYQSWPWEWPFLIRPTSFYYREFRISEEPVNCEVAKCVRAVHAIGTPILWWAGIIALLALIVWYAATRDWRAGAVLVGYGAGWLPWFYFAIADHRTMFFTYAVAMAPFMIMAIVLAFGLMLGPAEASSRRRVVAAGVMGAFLLLTVINFRWLYPILAGDLIPYEDWYSRMLFKSWI